MTIEGSEWVLVALLAGSMVSDPKKVKDRARTVAKAVEQFNRLSGQAREALDRAVDLAREEDGLPVAPKPEKAAAGDASGMSLIELAHKLGIPTEGRTAEEIANVIAHLALRTSEPG